MLDITHGMPGAGFGRATAAARRPRLVLTALALAVLAASAQARPASEIGAAGGSAHPAGFQFGPRLAPPQHAEPPAGASPGIAPVPGSIDSAGRADKEPPSRRWRPYQRPCNYTTGCH